MTSRWTGLLRPLLRPRPGAASLGDRFAAGVTALTAALVLALAVLSWAWVSGAQRDARGALEVGHAREIAAHLSGELHNLVSTLDEIASNRLLSNAIADSADGRSAYLRPFLGSIRSIGDVPVRVALCDFEGVPLTSNGLPAPVVTGALARAVVDGGEARAEVAGEGAAAELILAFPVVWPGTRRAEGLVVAAARVADLFGSTLDTHALGGHAAVFAGPRAIFTSGAGSALAPASLIEPVEAPPPLAALRLRVVVHPAPALAPIGLAAFFALLALASVTAFAGIARALAARLTRPVAALTAVAEEISQTGRLIELPAAEGEDETARLSRAFGRMIARTRDAQETLEQRVRERTAELERANAELRREVEERRRVERFAERVFASVGQGLAVIDRRFTVLTANGAFAGLAGRRSAEEVIGRRCHEVLFGREKPCDAHGEPCPAAWVLASGAAATGELVVGGRTLDTRCFPLKDEEGKVDAVIYAFTDVTERRALAEQVREAQKMEAIGHLAGGVAHDFNNIVAAVMGNAAVLRDELAGDRRCELADEILAASRRARELTAQLLAFGRKQTLRPRPLDPAKVVEGVRAMLRTLLPEDVELRVERDEGAPAVLADRGQLEQVIVNLVANARDAMPGGGTVTLTTRPATAEESSGSGPGAVISVADTGTGMDAATRARIFEPFFTTKPREKGTGLGLAVVYGIVTSHGGRIQVDSRPGRGSRFEVILPGTTARPEPERAGDRPARAPPGEGETILLAEDEERIRRLFRRVLEGQGYRVLEARDGREALALLRAPDRNVALALLDVVMPGANGPEVLEEARRFRPDLKAVMVSGYASDVLETRGGLDPTITLLPKPCLPAELLAAIRRTLDEA